MVGPSGMWMAGLMTMSHSFSACSMSQGSTRRPSLHRRGPQASRLRSIVIDGRYLTGQLLPCDVIHLMCSTEVRRAQLGLPRIRRVDTDPVPRVTGPARALKPRVVIGVIDDGFGFAHPRLLDSKGSPRVRYLWDQDARRETVLPDTYWTKPINLGYGAELREETLEGLVRKLGPDPIDPWAAYRAVRYGRYRLDPDALSSEPIDPDGRPLPVESMVGASHGHSVVDLVAGFPPTARGQLQPLSETVLSGPRNPEDASSAFKAAYAAALSTSINARPLRLPGADDELAGIDAADQWHLVLVQLPARTVADTSGGSLAVHVLDGIRYIVERALTMPYVDGDLDTTAAPNYRLNRVVVNISYGAMGGGHDGTSILEQAMQAFVRTTDLPAVWLVLAAGNAHVASAHARVELADDGPKTLTWLVGPDNPLESYLEIWLPDVDVLDRKVPIQTVRQIQVSVLSPDGQRLAVANCDEVWQLRNRVGGIASEPMAALIYSRRVVQSERGTMILLAVAPTRPRVSHQMPGLAAAAHGEWTVVLSWGDQGSNSRIAVHAWSERGDLVFGVPRAQQARVFSEDQWGEASEYDIEAMRAREVGRGVWNPRAPPGVRPRYSLSSLASTAPARERFAVPATDTADVLNRGAVIVVGGLRLNDGEVSQISSGGPSRLIGIEREQQHLQSRGKEPSPSERSNSARMAPDAMAPSDMSPAAQGLRSAGLHSAIEARISGTSAAAALVDEGGCQCAIHAHTFRRQLRPKLRDGQSRLTAVRCRSRSDIWRA